MAKVFSGIQPSGIIHLGNYLGAIKQWVELQKTHNCIYCIVDLHAITIPQDPKELTANIYRTAATYLAAGVDPEKSVIFIQSHRPEHTELAWILATITHMGELSRMTQFKEKSRHHSLNPQPSTLNPIGVGLFAYPTLMAADILLYQTDLVPVGKDQKQHVELTRDLAQRFNNKFGKVFTIPKPLINKATARIMGLDGPKEKMSKSATSPSNYIALTDDGETIRQKIAKAVTDSGHEIKAGPDKPALTNLLTIYSELGETPLDKLEKQYQNKGYAQFKKDLAEVVVAKITPLGKKIKELEEDKVFLRRLLEKGANKLEPLAQKTLREVHGRLGLI